MKALTLFAALALSLVTACGGTTTETDTGTRTDTGGGGGPTCAAYCTAVMASCTGANAQYADMAACMTACAPLAPGAATDTSGNTVGCRTYHAGAAAGDPATHCSHAGPTGGGVCS